MSWKFILGLQIRDVNIVYIVLKVHQKVTQSSDLNQWGGKGVLTDRAFAGRFS